MASCITKIWSGTTAPQARLTVTLDTAASDGDTAVLDWSLDYVAHGYAASVSVARDWSVTINGSAVKSGTFAINGITGTKNIASGSVNVAKGTAAKSISFGCSFEFALTWSGVYAGTLSASGSISIPAKTSYKVSYNANGGSGAPSAQTKWYGTALTLSSTKPTRTGYKFAGWATSASGSVAYAAGASYTADAAVTLYAKWTANTYTVSYNANGGTGAPSAQTKTYGVTLTLSSTKPTRTGYTFQGWGTSQAATTVKYAAGANYTDNAAITLYAVWVSSYTKPKISNLSAPRCTEDETLVDDGTYALVKFNWATTNAVTAITVAYKKETDTGWTQNAVSASGNSGSISHKIGGSLDVEASYSVCVTVTDSGGSTERYTTIVGQSFAIDVLAKGKGVAIGKPAESEDTFDVAWLAHMRDHLCVGDKTAYLDGKQGIMLSNEGFMHLQRTTAQGYHPYIGFLLDDATSVSGQIRVNCSTKDLELLAANAVMVNKEFRSEYGDTAFIHVHPTSGAKVGFGVGAGGVNRGIYDSTLSQWLFKGNGTDTFLASAHGEFKPYYSVGDTISTKIQTGGYCTNSKTEVRFCLPLSRPVIGVSTVTASSVDGFILRQGGAYTHGSAAGTRAHPSSYECSYNGGNTLYIVATFADTTDAANNAACGIDASIKITFA